MNNTELLSQKTIKRIEPTMVSLMQSELKKAYDAFLLSDEFKNKAKEVDTIAYDKNDKYSTQALELALNEFKDYLEKYNDFNLISNYTILNNFLQEVVKKDKEVDVNVYRISRALSELNYNSKFNEELENSEDKVNHILDSVKKSIETYKEEYIKNCVVEELNIRPALYQDTYDELIALLATTQNNKLTTIKQTVLDYFDFNEVIKTQKGNSWLSRI